MKKQNEKLRETERASLRNKFMIKVERLKWKAQLIAYKAEMERSKQENCPLKIVGNRKETDALNDQIQSLGLEKEDNKADAIKQRLNSTESRQRNNRLEAIKHQLRPGSARFEDGKERNVENEGPCVAERGQFEASKQLAIELILKTVIQIQCRIKFT